jgi:hypothetical protein
VQLKVAGLVDGEGSVAVRPTSIDRRLWIYIMPFLCPQSSLSHTHSFTPMPRSSPACLANVTLVYIGDSTSRYEYLELVQRLHGRLGPEFDSSHAPLRDTLPSSECHASAPRHGKSETWTDFYSQSTAAFGGRMLCDCMRLSPRNASATALSQTVENRVYVAPDGAYRLAFFQWFGQYEMPRGSVDVCRALGRDSHARAGALSERLHALPCPPGLGSEGNWRWHAGVDGLLRMLAAVRPTHVILNAGHWETAGLGSAVWHAIVRAGVALKADTSARVFWRTTPRRADADSLPRNVPWASLHDVDVTHFVRAGWEVYDAAALVRERRRALNVTSEAQVFIDDVHVQPQINRMVLARFVEREILGCRSLGEPAPWPPAEKWLKPLYGKAGRGARGQG